MTTPDEFAQRYAVEIFESDGVIVDLKTGNYFRVDRRAAIACAALSAGDPESGADEVARLLKIAHAHAARLLVDTRAALDAAPVRGTPTGPYHYHPEPGGFGLWHEGHRVLAVTSGDLEILVPPDQPTAQSPLLEFYVRALAPKIMFARGISILHASACATNGTLAAFAGPSGAGKTTTARAFVREGARPICEDLLVLAPDTDQPSVVLGSEERVHTWAKDVTDRLAAGATRVASTDLATMASGPSEVIHLLHVLDVARRDGSDFAVRALSDADALLALIANDFLGDATPASWRRYLRLARWMAGGVKVFEAGAPAGVDALGSAARRYMSTWTS